MELLQKSLVVVANDLQVDVLIFGSSCINCDARVPRVKFEIGVNGSSMQRHVI